MNRRSVLKGGIVFAATAHSAIANDSLKLSCLAALGDEFDRLYETYRVLNEASHTRVDAFKRKMLEEKIPHGSPRWLAGLNECNPEINAASDAGEAAEAVATMIRDAEAVTVNDLYVKARILRFDLCLHGDPGTPMNEWDWDAECLHRFIEAVETLALQPHASGPNP